MKRDQRLHCLSPKNSFIAVEALKHAAVEIGKTQEAVGQLARCAAKVICGVVEAVRLMLLYNLSPKSRPRAISCLLEGIGTYRARQRANDIVIRPEPSVRQDA